MSVKRFLYAFSSSIATGVSGHFGEIEFKSENEMNKIVDVKVVAPVNFTSYSNFNFSCEFAQSPLKFLSKSRTFTGLETATIITIPLLLVIIGTDFER